jgi:hypothetical protein
MKFCFPKMLQIFVYFLKRLILKKKIEENDKGCMKMTFELPG